MLNFFATAPKGLEQLLAEELRGLGANEVAETRAGVSFSGTLETAYRACLWSRLANRILLPISQFPAPTPEALYTGVKAIPWREHLQATDTLAVDFSSSQSAISHTHFGALKVKDAIVDQMRDEFGERPSIDTERPSLRVNLYLNRDEATLSLDLSGDSLHRRAYRERALEAPLKENLAAALLLRSGWAQALKDGRPLWDPLCGSGTLPIEAALMAWDRAPGLMRRYFGFLGWRQHDAGVWQGLKTEAEDRAKAARATSIIGGFDADPRAVRIALGNIERAGLSGKVQIDCRRLADFRPSQEIPGLVICNPPYGERLGEVRDLVPLYQELGDVLKQHFAGWSAHVLTSSDELAFALRLKPDKKHAFFNGAIPCKLLHFTMHAIVDKEAKPRSARQAEAILEAGAKEAQSDGATMVKNRLRKNLQTLGKWAQRENIRCYRVYDADLPEYAVAVDIYEQWAHVQEYVAPQSIDPKVASRRLREVLAVLPEALNLPQENIFFKQREKQKGKAQYSRQDRRGIEYEIAEGGHQFLVNLTDYLDTGIFLDHRKTRALLQKLAKGRHFLNLFCYTATASVYAAKGGALSTTSIDTSNAYLDWAQRNFELNRLPQNNNKLLRADCLEWLREAGGNYGLIFLDPPTFSNSKSHESILDIQRDHVDLIRACMELLDKDGVLVFSNNHRRFKLDKEALSNLRIEDISAATLPQDFARNPRIHQAFQISKR